MIKKILIATDGTSASKKAELEGIELAKKAGAKVIAVYVFDIDAINVMDVGSDELDRLIKSEIGKGERSLKNLERLAVKNGVDMVEVLREGDPVTEILNISQEYGIDLVVIGTHKRKGFKKLIYGSVSDSFLKDAPCPVVVAY
jgi:nucleotide-binding universal stress UspA family protein